MNNLQVLSQSTKIVSDTGDLASITACQPLDTTTNPSLLLQIANKPEYQHFIETAISQTNITSAKDSVANIKLAFTTLVGCEILSIIQGRLSIEVDAKLSFDTAKTIQKAHQIIDSFAQKGIDKKRILIKIAATWEGILAAQILQKEGINCNLTLIFSLEQSLKCAQVGVKLISPFVGRITDWHKLEHNIEYFEAAQDPGVLSVVEIYNTLKKFDYPTEIMGASFRNIEQIKALNGCDLLTISPSFINELKTDTTAMSTALSVERAKQSSAKDVALDEKHFRWALNQNKMAHDKLSEGIRSFYNADVQLEDKISQMIC